VRAAFKDWAIVVDALGRGDQILILRKGGISEGKGGFKVAHEEFLLYPTLYHQQREMVIVSAQSRYDEIAAGFPPKETVRIEHSARVVEWREVVSLEKAKELHDQHIWLDQVIEERFEWGREQKIFAIALRVNRLPKPVEFPMRDEYGGCKSWIEFAEDVDVSRATPVLNDDAFQERLRDFRSVLS
tara:strand:- start:2626 stop:3183 length:558 start_codon:yes stop_codon:yes gene_type:complete